MLIGFDKAQFDKLQYRSAETTIEDVAKKLATLTAPDKIDMNVAQFGNRVAIVEIRERPDLNKVEARASELTIGQFRRMIRTLPEDHHLGLVTIILARNFQHSELYSFLKKHGKRRKFNTITMLGTATAKEIFEAVFRTPETEGSC